MTGETENGRSIKVSRKLFQKKSNFVTHQDATTPKNMLRGTEMIATVRVSFTAEIASLSVIAAKYVSRPWLNASVKMMMIGISKKIITKISEIAISKNLEILLSSVGFKLSLKIFFLNSSN